jgi:hypothetical protein
MISSSFWVNFCPFGNLSSSLSLFLPGKGGFLKLESYGESVMTKFLLYLSCALFIVILFFPHAALPQKADPIIVDFKVQSMYRAAKLSWKVQGALKGGLIVQILRADTFEEGPYKEVDTVKMSPGKNSYAYIDKSMGAEAKYYYKLIIKDTNETFGPLPTRPYFSPPAT